MVTRRTIGSRVFRVVNVLVLSTGALLCLLPFVHVLAVSLSSKNNVTAGFVTLWPMTLTSTAYTYVLNRPAFWRAFVVSIERVALGASINLLLTIVVAFPLSKESRRFRWRTFYSWCFFVTMLFSGGLIPLYTVVKDLRLLDTPWSLVLPGAVPVFNVLLMLNFYRQIPHELEEAASMDGAGHWRTLWQIYVPCSLPSIATIALFCIVGHWNAWFDGLIFMNRPEHYPLQSYLQNIIIGLNMERLTTSDWQNLAELSDRSVKCAQIIVATIPILAVYPFLQRYFVAGIVLGSVKG